MYGYDSAFIGGTLNPPSFQARYGLDVATDAAKANLSSNIVSTFQGGAFFGSAMGCLFAESFGRKPMLVFAAMIFSVGAGLQLAGMLSCLYAGRILTGWGVGATATILPIYVSECSPAQIRGRLVGVFEIMLQLALVCGFWVSYGVNRNISAEGDKQWHIAVAVQLVPAGVLMIAMIPMPESPRWLMSKGPAIDYGVQEEIGSASSGRDWRQILIELKQVTVRRRLLLSCGLMLGQNFIGINAINYYSPTIFISIGFTGTSNGLLATGIFGIVKVTATMLYAAFLVDKVGRRKFLLVGGAGAMVAMFYLAGYSNISGSFNQVPPMGRRCKDRRRNEILPNRVRTVGMAICVCWQWLTQFIVAYSLPHMILGISYGTFLFFGICSLIAIVFAWLFIPEIKGIELEDMGLLFGDGVPWRAQAARKHYLEHQRTVAQSMDEKLGDVEEKPEERAAHVEI